jgi:ADP-heptose:LPS heptosyltransferase
VCQEIALRLADIAFTVAHGGLLTVLAAPSYMSPTVQKLYAFSMARYFDLLRLKHGRPVVLFFRDGGIGDILCTLPVAAALSARHQNALKIYCTNPGFVDLPRVLPGAFDRVIGIKSNDLVAAASRRHIVYRLRYPDEDPGRSSGKYLVDEFAEPFGLPDGLPWPKLDLGPASAKVNALFSKTREPVVCIHTGPTWAVREWPIASWDAFSRRIREATGARVLQIGASKHFREGARRERPVEGVEDCRDVFTLVETLQIVARSQLFVGIDSGMIHGAVAFGVPAIGVFGPTSSAYRLPRRSNVVGMSADVPCLGCHHRHPRLHWQSGCANGIQCMQGLSAERVASEAMELLRGEVGSAIHVQSPIR